MLEDKIFIEALKVFLVDLLSIFPKAFNDGISHICKPQSLIEKENLQGIQYYENRCPENLLFSLSLITMDARQECLSCNHFSNFR